jgi:RNA recognition motif-containing protein
MFTVAGFEPKGAKITMVENGNNKKSKGYGFVEFNSEDELVAAIKKFEDAELEERKLELKRAFGTVSI